MNKEELFVAFKVLFPTWAAKVGTYKKIGSHTLAIQFVEQADEEKMCAYSRVFLYYGPDNWQFGTKLWRKRPERARKEKNDGRE